MSEEYGNDFVTLIDEDGNEVEFEHIDTVEYEGTTYLAFIPAELSLEEDAEVVIMQIVEEDGEEMLEAVEDDEIADAVFNIVMERAEARGGRITPPVQRAPETGNAVSPENAHRVRFHTSRAKSFRKGTFCRDRIDPRGSAVNPTHPKRGFG